MFSGIKTDGMFGGGQGEQMFRSLMIDQYAKPWNSAAASAWPIPCSASF